MATEADSVGRVTVMKRIVAIILLMMLMVGCAKVENAKAKEEKEVSRFVVIETTMQWEVVADKETGVMYAVSCGVYNNGTFTLLVDADGKPLIYKGE